MDSSLTADGRPLTAEHLETAIRHFDHHLPLDEDSPDPVCTSAVHRVVPPRWPCRDIRWAERVLAAHGRGEISGVDLPASALPLPLR